MTPARPVAVLCALLAFGGTALAQDRSGSITGTVRDSSGGILPGATVTATSPALVGVQNAVSDGQGTYRFPALTPGVYEITVQLQGFTMAKTPNVQLALGQTLRADFALEVATLTETVSVTAVSPVIDVKQNAAISTITAELIERIPTGRDFTDLIRTAPGTQQERKSGIQIDGAGSSEHRYVIDGMDTTGIRTGVSGQEMPVDFMQEVQVKASGYNAEFRATTGGVISAITKTGSNEWRGRVGYYFRNVDKNHPRQTLRLNPVDQTKAEHVTTPADEFEKHEPTIELGGPILRNRAWFFLGVAPDIERQSRTVTFRTNNQKATFEQNEEDYNTIFNVTSQLNSKMRLKGTINRQSFRDEPAFPTIEPDGTSTSNPTLFPGTIIADTFDNFYVGALDWVMGPKLFTNVTVGLYDYGTHGSGAGEQLRHTFGASNLQSGSFNFPEIPDSLRFVNGYADFPSSSVTKFDDFKRHSVNADMSYFANKWGQHSIKAGFQYERIGNSRLGGAQFPTVNLFWGAGRNAFDGRTNVRGTYGYYTVTRVYNSGDIQTNGLGIFLQDAWTVGKNVTLNLGIRTDKEEIPSYTEGNEGIKFGFGEKISPRAGFAWDIKGDGRWKGYGSFGIFYDTSKLEMPRGLFGSEHSVTHFMTLDTFNWPAIQCGHPPVPGPTCPGTYIEQVDGRHAANEKDNFLIDPNLKPIRTHELTFGMDHELTQRISVGVRYSRKRFDRTIEDTGVQVPGIGEVYRITNPGEGIGENVLRDFAGCTNCPNQPKPTRNYDGVEFRFVKRLSNRWALTSTYLYSRLYGNYSGLTSSDENSRNSPSVNRFFDGQFNSFDRLGKPVFGRLQTDRPHVFKIEGAYDTPWGTGVGLYWLAENGTPMQTEMRQQGIPFFPFGRGNLGRTPALTRTDLSLRHDFRVWNGNAIEIGMNIENLFDQDFITRWYALPYRDTFNVPNATFFSGTFDPVAVQAAAPATFRPDARFGLPDQYQTRREMRLQLRYSF